jgi:transposase-like protein
MIAKLKKKYSLSNSSLARQFGLSYTTLMRWKRRLTMGQPVLENQARRKSGLSTSANSDKKSATWNTAPNAAVESAGCMMLITDQSPGES